MVATWSILTPRRRGRGSAIGLHLSATWLHRLDGRQFRRQAVRIISGEIQRHEWKERHANLRFSRCADIGRAFCRERVCQYEYISVVAGSLKEKKKETNTI